MNCKRKFIVVALSALLIFAYRGMLHGQELSTQGTDFWLTFMRNYSATAEVDLSVTISAEEACSGTISNQYNGWSEDFTIEDNEKIIITIPREVCYCNQSDTVTNYGIHIETTKNVSVFAMNYYLDSFDGSNIYQTEALRSTYMIQTYTPRFKGSEFSIVATEDNTSIDITPSATTSGGHSADSTYTITLDRGQTYLVQTQTVTDDFSGSIVEAKDDKKIAVFAGNVLTEVPYGISSADHIYEQMPPVDYWGKKFVITKTGVNADRIRVTACKDGTEIRKNGEILDTISARQTYEFELSDSSAFLQASKPVLTVLYISGQQYHRIYQDPSMVVLYPIEQSIESVIFATYQQESTYTHYVNIATKTSVVSSVKLDGASISDNFERVTGNDSLSYARIQISDGKHKLECEYGLTAHIYGIGDVESYAYSAGSNVRFINKIDTLYVFDSICQGENYTLHGFNYINPQVGTYSDTITYKDEYDVPAFYYLTLTVNPTYNLSYDDIIFVGGEYHAHGFDTTGLAVGTYVLQHQYTTVALCDSIITVNLTVEDIYRINIEDTACSGDDYNLFGFHLSDLDVGITIDSLKLNAVDGRDSIVYLKLYVTPEYSFNVADTACEWGEYHNYGLDLYGLTQGDHSYTSNLVTQHGCDSIYDVALYVDYTYEAPDTIYGMINVFVSADLITGIYIYRVDSIIGCTEYNWSAESDEWPRQPSWILEPDGQKCTVTITSPVEAKIIVSAENRCGLVQTDLAVTGEFYGIEEGNAINASVYPNPTKGVVNVECEGIVKINVMNVTGLIIKTLEFDREDKVTVDISDFPKALYIFDIETSQGKCMKRITKAVD